jgi:hypothetical protein
VWILPELRTRLMEWKVAVHVHVLIGHEYRPVKVEEQQRE